MGAAFGLGDRAAEYRVLLVLVVIQGFTWFLVLPLMPLYAQRLGAEPTVIGFLMAATAFIQVVLCIPGGLLVRRIGERGVFFVSFILGVAAACTYYLAPDYRMLFAGQLLFGAANAVFWPSLASYLGELGSTLKTGGGRLISFALGLNAVSYLAGPPLAGYLLEGVEPRYIFVVYCVMCLLGIERVRTLVRPSEPSAGADDLPGGTLTAQDGGLALFGLPTFRFVVIGTWFSFGTWAVLDTLFPLHVSALGYSASVLGLMLTLRSVVIVICRFAAAHIGERIGFHRTAIMALGVLAVSLISISLTDVPWILVLASSLAGTGPGFLPVSNVTLLSATLSSARRPVGMAINEVFVGTGRLMGSSVSGMLAATLGFGSAIGSVGFVLIAAAGLLAHLSGPFVRTPRSMMSRTEV